MDCIPTMSLLYLLHCLAILWTCHRPYLFTIFSTVFPFFFSLTAATILLLLFSLPHIVSLKHFCSFATLCTTVFFLFCNLFIPQPCCLLHALTLGNTAHFSNHFHDFFTPFFPSTVLAFYL